MAFADGGTRFISEGVDYHVYQQIMTPDASKSDLPFPNYLLSGEDLE